MFLEIISKEIIVESTKLVLGLLTDLEDHEDPYVNKVIEELDINSKISVIKSLINSKSFRRIDYNSKILQNIDIYTVNLCIKNLNDIIDKISDELKKISELIPEHKLKWFHTWRTPEYHNNVENLKKYNIIMESRLNLFLDILKTIH